jgi:hypothetical protein
MGSREIYQKITDRMTATRCQDPFSRPATHAQHACDLITGPQREAATEPQPERTPMTRRASS